jgi:hypothetical protein
LVSKKKRYQHQVAVSHLSNHLASKVYNSLKRNVDLSKTQWSVSIFHDTFVLKRKTFSAILSHTSNKVLMKLKLRRSFELLQRRFVLDSIFFALHSWKIQTTNSKILDIFERSVVKVIMKSRLIVTFSAWHRYLQKSAAIEKKFKLHVLRCSQRVFIRWLRYATENVREREKTFSIRSLVTKNAKRVVINAWISMLQIEMKARAVRSERRRCLLVRGFKNWTHTMMLREQARAVFAKYRE